MNQNFKNMFKITFCSYLQIMKTVCQTLILYLSIFSVYGHGAGSGEKETMGKDMTSFRKRLIRISLRS